MKLPPIVLASALAVLLACPAAPGVEKSAREKPAAASARAANVYGPTDLEALRTALGKNVTVEGTIVASGESKTKTVRYLNFTKNYRESLGLVFFVSKGGEEFALKRLAAWVGKKIRATGKVGEHDGSLQIEIEKWSQVQEVP
ncbi:MAG: hypothetical protein QOE70_3462 [Chthoniobacter sp.]|jgi:RecJ-like exonuclease|nr:hypothetical protein [Chthoniobacter sp.]